MIGNQERNVINFGIDTKSSTMMGKIELKMKNRKQIDNSVVQNQ